MCIILQIESPSQHIFEWEQLLLLLCPTKPASASSLLALKVNGNEMDQFIICRLGTCRLNLITRKCSCVCGWVERTFLVDVWRYDYDGNGLRKRALRVCLSHCSLLIYQSSSADPLLLLLTHWLTPTINNNYVCDMSQTHSGVVFHYRAYLFESHIPIYAELYRFTV